MPDWGEVEGLHKLLAGLALEIMQVAAVNEAAA